MGSPGRTVYAVKAHVRDLPTARYSADEDGFVWLDGGTFSGNVCASWKKAKLYRSPGAAASIAASHQVFGRPGTDTYHEGAVPGRYTLVTFDTVAVDETVRTRAAS